MASLLSYQDCSPAEVLHPSQGEPSFSVFRARKTLHFVWYFASWDVRTVLDLHGSIETAKQAAEFGVCDERKIDQAVDEMKKYQVNVAGLQETKWFGAEIPQSSIAEINLDPHIFH